MELCRARGEARWQLRRRVLAGPPASGRPRRLPPIAELQTAKGTVIEGCAEKSRQAAQRVPAHTVHLIAFRQFGEFPVSAARAFRNVPEQQQPRAPDVKFFTAGFASKDRPIQNFL